MHMQRQGSTQLNCFSPPVMVATVLVESCLFLYTLWRYKLNALGRVVTMSLLALATFQLCEYFVCTSYGLRAEQWSRLGYVAITTLPPLGLHMLHILADKKQRRLVLGGYITMLGFIVYFLSYHAAFIGYQCTGNYVIFQIGMRPALFYGIYYYGWLLTAIVLGFVWAKRAASAMSKNIEALVIGYFVFLLPTALVNSLSPATRRGIPSIMCGFAVLYALILVLYILPRAALRRRLTDSR